LSQFVVLYHINDGYNFPFKPVKLNFF